MPQNYKLDCSFGSYLPGAVVPEHVLAGHDVARLIELGLVAPTDLPVNVPLAVPAKVPPAVPDDVAKERDRLAAENAELRRADGSLRALLAAAEKARDTFSAKCNEYTLEVEHLKGACEHHQSKIAELEAANAQLQADLEAATAPAPAAKK